MYSKAGREATEARRRQASTAQSVRAARVSSRPVNRGGSKTDGIQAVAYSASEVT
jgi:hypothetical protein